MKKSNEVKSTIEEIKKDIDKGETPKISRDRGSYIGSYVKNTSKKPKIVTIQKIKANPFFNVSMELHFISDFLTAKESVLFANSCGKSHNILKIANLARVLRVHVVRGNQETAEAMVRRYPGLVLIKGEVTDYSGRRFNCTAYEYAYWAKDTHMCRMLEQHMDKNIKAVMLEKVIAVDTVGLTYKQPGKKIENSKHFDMTPLITGLKNYVNGYDAWYEGGNYDAMVTAWMQVGLAQRDLPVHVINEYCRSDRSFHRLQESAFKEDILPRVLTYSNYFYGVREMLFPLVASRISQLGVNFALYRGGCELPILGDVARLAKWDPNGGWTGPASLDLAAIIRLDEVRTDDLARSRENLSSEHGFGMNL